MKSESGSGKYTVLEGNRRAAAMRILKNPAVLTGLGAAIILGLASLVLIRILL